MICQARICSRSRIVILMAFLFFFVSPLPVSAQVKNLILFIGDGMGDEQIRASAWYFYDQDEQLFSRLPSRGRMRTESLGGAITDSAAAATAMATGVKTVNGYVGRNEHAHDVDNILELAKNSGRRTGIVTDISISHATPAGFAAHADHRTKTNHIVDSLLSRARPNILFGSALEINPEWARFKGYEVIRERSKLLEANVAANKEPYFSGQFGTYNIPWAYEDQGQLPRLSEMTTKALELLDGERGFFLIVEAGKIDWASHGENLYQVIYEVRALEQAVRAGLDWAQDRTDTLIIVTADHETGGLDLLRKRGLGQVPEHRWTGPEAGTGNVGHTSRPVSVFAWGEGHAAYQGDYENTDLFHKMKSSLAISDPID